MEGGPGRPRGRGNTRTVEVGAQSRRLRVVCPVAGGELRGWGLGSQGCGLSGSDQGGLWGGPWWRGKEGVKRRHTSSLEPEWEEETRGPQQGPGLQSFQREAVAAEATREPSTCWAAPVETEQVEQLLRGQLWGGDRTTPGASQRGSRTLPGCFAEMQLLALSSLSGNWGGGCNLFF